MSGSAPAPAARLATGAIGLIAIALLASPGAASGDTADRPLGIPALRKFEPSSGTWAPGARPRIVFRHRDRAKLRGVARLLARDLELLLGGRVRVRASAAGRARDGDIVLRRSKRRPRLGAEGYRLRIGRTFTIAAPTKAGVFYGGRTLLQMVRAGEPVRRGRAWDRPRYRERGLMLLVVDPQRLLPWWKAFVREMGFLKLNLLHLHLTDNAFWGIESDSHPEIVTSGALTKRQVRGLLRVARRHHVEVVPEIDMPGHAGTILDAHPELGLRDATGAPPPGLWHSLDISKPATRAFVKDILEEYLPLFRGRYWHMGGDEYLTPEMYSDYPQLLADARRRYGPEAGVQDEINGFFNWVERIVRRHGKRLRAWSDQFAPGNVVDIDKRVIAEWWTPLSPLSIRPTREPARLAADGHRVMNDGWFPTYYAGDVPGAIVGRPGTIEGTPDPAAAYETWAVTEFCGGTIDGVFLVPCLGIEGREGRIAGSKVNVWVGGDAEPPMERLAADLFPRLRVIAQKTWDSTPLTPSYGRFAEIMRTLGHAPSYPRR